MPRDFSKALTSSTRAAVSRNREASLSCRWATAQEQRLHVRRPAAANLLHCRRLSCPLASVEAISESTLLFMTRELHREKCRQGCLARNLPDVDQHLHLRFGKLLFLFSEGKLVLRI